MEYAAMELSSGLMCSGAAFEQTPEAEAGTTAWSSWLKALVEARHGTASLQKAPLWASSIAQALRMLANAGTSTIPAIRAEFQTRNAADICLVIVDFVCEQVSFKVTGSSTGDVKFSKLLAYSIDMLVQACSTQYPMIDPKPALAHNRTLLLYIPLSCILRQNCRESRAK